jgi:hypothetical protein
LHANSPFTMNINFARNVQFTSLIKAQGRLREFNFRKTQDSNGVLFSADVTDERGYRIMFQLQKNTDTWKIIPQPLPTWILEQESTYHDLIEKEGA